MQSTFINHIARPLNFLACGGLDRANQKEIQNEDVFGLNVQNLLGLIPFYNFFIGIGRIDKSVTHIQSLGKYLSDSDKEEMNRCYKHIGRAVVEIPFGGIIFLPVDIICSVVKFVINQIKNKKSLHGNTAQNKLDDMCEVHNALKRNYDKSSKEPNNQNRLNDLKKLVVQYLINYAVYEENIPQTNNSYYTNELKKFQKMKLGGSLIPFKPDEGQSNEECAEAFMQSLTTKVN